MKLVKPITITDTELTSSTVAETDYAAYAATTTYALGDKVIVLATHRVYESLQAANTGHYPPDSLAAPNLWWLDLGATNRWKMFDDKVYTQTTASNSITVVLAPGKVISDIGLLRVDAATVSAVMTDPTDGEVYNQTISMVSTDGIVDYWDWMFSEIDRTDTALFSGIPPYADAAITITISYPSGTAACGKCVIGPSSEIGSTKYGMTVRIKSYSRKETDEFGNATLLKRNFAKLVSGDVWVMPERFNAVVRVMQDYESTEALWIFTDVISYRTSAVDGFYRDMSVIAENYGYSICNIEIEGLI